MSKPRKPRRDSKLSALPEEQRQLIADWLAQDGVESCLQRMSSELGITSNRDSVYKALARWRSEARFANFLQIAQGMAQHEAALHGLSPEKMEEAVDKHFLMLAAQNEDTTLYKELRYLRVADQSAKANARIAEAKLKQGDKKLLQKDADLKLAERRVVLLEQKIADATKAAEDKTLSAEDRAQRMREILKA